MVLIPWLSRLWWIFVIQVFIISYVLNFIAICILCKNLLHFYKLLDTDTRKTNRNSFVLLLADKIPFFVGIFFYKRSSFYRMKVSITLTFV